MKLNRFLCALLAAFLVAGCNSDDGPTGTGGNNNPPTAQPTNPGTPDGAPSTGTIGAAGGSLTTADGAFKLDVPAGALASDTEITIQPITNTAWGGVGAAYRLTPDGLHFATRVSLIFEFTAAQLDGSAPEFLDAAVQDSAGLWYVLGHRSVDLGESTLTCQTSHFSDYSLIEGVQIVPAHASIDVNEQVALSVRFCAREVYDGGGVDDDLIALVVTCDEELAPLGTFSNWSVNGVPGGSGAHGTVVATADDRHATYTAPAAEPSPNPVAVSVEASYAGHSELLVSNITIGEERWVGTSTTDYEGAFVVTTTVTWKLLSTVGTKKSFYPTGDVTVTWYPIPGCVVSLDPGEHPIVDQDGMLEVDYATDPPTYSGVGETSWDTSFCVTCTPNPIVCNPILAGGAWFYSTGGSVSGDGTTIEGTSDIGGAANTFSFTREQP